ncbi:MAG: class II fructose-bisphosphatase [Thermomicrobiales bacterium]
MAQQHVNVDRNLAMELVRVTEAAALAASRWVGKGDKIAADGAAVDAMRAAIDSVAMDGVVVIGEGEKDDAPMLFIGERVGMQAPGTPKVEIAVDPIDGTTLTSKGMPNAVAVIGMSEEGTLYDSHGLFYMNKLATGRDAARVVDISAPVATNLANVAKAKGMNVSELTVCVLDRPRHADLVKEIRAAGARIKFISDGDVAGCIMTCLPGTGVDLYLGTGGAPECVITACALKCLGGTLQAKPWPRPDTDDAAKAKAKGLDLDSVLDLNDLAKGDNTFFACTGITDGELVRGVHYSNGYATTESLVMRSKTGTVRRIVAQHRIDKVRQYGFAEQ